ncbi:tyrosine-protein phosphatase [Paenibacillus sp. GSMTC-2017]|uniref:tyrosine-protein phosphatase n=1 Tax=Paenibacillus sp. GSMTC-2017 TaxID=2794350 RepID=UPI0018D8803E|nr:tyrosine-protein phosphatase [Paenibacillus sp. GSMTC-2017]MBH5316424.1 tyrosine-protein phosphatase [Paenibacillus sp. GSMTC-2017]
MNTAINAVHRGERQFINIGNFRDIGGLPTSDGRMMRTGILFRSDEPSQLTVQEMEKFQTLKLKKIYDLRTPNERASKLFRILNSQRPQIINVPIQQNEKDYTRFQYFKLLMTSARTIDLNTMMKDFYRKIAFQCTDQIKEIIVQLADEDELPALIHCTSGKDRTGMLAALIQLLVGVPYSIVMEDYLFSNELNQSRADQQAKLIRKMSLFRLSKDRLKPLLEVRRDYLEDILEEILSKYGTIENYLIKACGISEKTLQNLRDKLIT